VDAVSNSDRSRRRALLVAVGLAAAAGGAGLAWWRLSPRPVADDAVADFWGLTFETPQGGTMAMSQLRGRPVLLNFWATWCPPCVEELPLLDAFFRENSATGWQVVGVAVDQAGAVRDFLARQPLSFPVVLAGMGGAALSKSFGNATGGLPFSVVLGADGVVRGRKIGKLSAQELTLWRALK
jgi:thiol-disulfide isomerase/thioredoxin